MQFDPKLEQKILRALTVRSDPLGWVSDFCIEGYDAEIVARHVKLAAEKGLIEAQDLSSHDGFEWAPRCLTAAGYEALEYEKKSKLAPILDLGGKLFWQVATAVLTAILIAVILTRLGLSS